jgi:hypothetical protein
MAAKDTKPPHPPATRRPKPRDLAEAHKPSRKVALNEVLRSLQDLVNNELATPPKTPVAEENHAPAAEAGVLPAAEPVVEPEVTFPEQPPPPEPQAPLAEVPPEGLQQELPLAPEPPPPPPVAEPVVPAEPIAPVEPGAAPLPELPTPLQSEAPAEHSPPEAEAGTETPPLAALPAHDLAPAPGEPAAADVSDLGEIPLLEDIIEFHEESESRTAPAARPPASEGRRLAIQVAARLNVELRKAGKPGLGSEVITRLARLLEEALAKAGTNMENTPPEDH